MIDWNDKTAKITLNFTVHEATYLPSWGVHHIPNEEEKKNIIEMAQKMEQVREYLGDKSINVNCWIRPNMVNCENPRYWGKNYNKAIGGADLSAHLTGKAVDFTVSSISCDEVRYLLQDQLEKLNLRMEKKPASMWIHLGNDWEPRKQRYFIP